MIKSAVPTARLQRGLLLILTLSACVLGLVTILVWQDQFTTLDFNLTVKLQDNVSRTLDPLLGLLVELGSIEVMTGVLLLVIWKTRQSVPSFLWVIFLYLLGMITVLALKNTLSHPAPIFMFQRDSGIGQFSPFYVQTESSYPSGHTYRAFFILTYLAMRLSTQRRSPILASLPLLAAGMIALSLIVLGKHWFSDILGGASLAIFLVSGHELFVRRGD